MSIAIKLTGKWEEGLSKEDLTIRLQILCESLFKVAHNLQRAVLGSHTSPFHNELYKRMYNPQVGDLVFEITSGGRDINPIWRLGTLIRRGGEKLCTLEEWLKETKDTEDEDKPIPEQIVYYIRTFDGYEIQWYNAMFVAIDFEMPFP